MFCHSEFLPQKRGFVPKQTPTNNKIQSKHVTEYNDPSLTSYMLWQCAFPPQVHYQCAATLCQKTSKFSYELTNERSVHHAMHITGVPLSLLLEVKCISSELCIQSNKHYIQEENRLHISAKMIIHHQT